MTDLEKFGIPDSERTKCEIWACVWATIARLTASMLENRERLQNANTSMRKSAAVANK